MEDSQYWKLYQGIQQERTRVEGEIITLNRYLIKLKDSTDLLTDHDSGFHDIPMIGCLACE